MLCLLTNLTVITVITASLSGEEVFTVINASQYLLILLMEEDKTMILIPANRDELFI